MLKSPLDPWSKGQKILAAHLQQPVAALQGVEEFLGFHGEDDTDFVPVPVLVKLSGTTIDGATPGFGKYAGVFVTPTVSKVVVTGALAESDIGTASTDVCLILNLGEVPGTGHFLSASDPQLIFVGMVTGTTAAGTPVVTIDGKQWEAC